MRKLLLITTLLLGLVLLAQAENPSLETHLSRGYDYINKRQYEDAIIEFLEVLSLDPENSKAIEGIERARFLKKEPVRKVLPIEPAPKEAEEKIKEVEKLEAPKREEARLRYSNVLTLLILLPLLLLGFSLTLIYYQKRHNRILKRYTELLTYERTSGYLPENKDLVKMLANLYKEEEIFDSTSALAYERAEMFAEAALSYHNSKDLTKAAEMYEKKSSLEGDDNAILQRLAQIYYDLGQEDRMVSIFRRMVAVREEPYDLSILGELCEKLKDTEGAISAYEKLSQLDRESPEYQDKLLKLYFDNGHKEKFFTLAEEVQMRRELASDILPKLGRIYVENSLFDKASEVYRKLTEEKPEHRYQLIETLVIQSRIDEALEECQKLPLTNSQEVNNLLDLYGKISEKHPDNGHVKNLIEEIYRKAEEKGLEVNLPTSNHEREQISRTPVINAQEAYSILTEKSTKNPNSDQ
jgi:tetratricopeptide (TPR) repeat protein